VAADAHASSSVATIGQAMALRSVQGSHI